MFRTFDKFCKKRQSIPRLLITRVIGFKENASVALDNDRVLRIVIHKSSNKRFKA